MCHFSKLDMVSYYVTEDKPTNKTALHRRDSSHILGSARVGAQDTGVAGRMFARATIASSFAPLKSKRKDLRFRLGTTAARPSRWAEW